jgi:hypothetical protein
MINMKINQSLRIPFSLLAVSILVVSCKKDKEEDAPAPTKKDMLVGNT